MTQYIEREDGTFYVSFGPEIDAAIDRLAKRGATSTRVLEEFGEFNDALAARGEDDDTYYRDGERFEREYKAHLTAKGLDADAFWERTEYPL